MTGTQGVNLTAVVKGGKLDLTAPQRKLIADYLASREGKPVALKMGPPKSVRTQKQNALYWAAIVTPIADKTGNTPGDVHDFLRLELLPPRFVTLGGVEKEIRRTTTDLTPKEFAAYIARCAAWAAQNEGLVLDIEV